MQLRSRRRRRVAVLLAALVVSGCGPGAGQSGETPQSTRPDATGLAVETREPSPTVELLPDGLPVPAIAGSSAGDPGSGLITVVHGGTVSTVADDGTRYTLVIPPGAVAEDVTVEVRPLAGSSDLGPIVAGADFAPAGLELALAGTLTVQLPAPAPLDLVALSYAGDVASTTGGLLPGPGRDAERGTLVFSVPHFSGSVGVTVTAGGAAMATTWLGIGAGTTPAARQAVARTRYAGASLARRRGTMPLEEAQDVMRRAVDEWMHAELDRLLADGTMQALATNGDPADLGALASAVGHVYQFDQSRQAEAPAADSGVPESTSRVVQEYGDRLGRVAANLGKAAAGAAGSGRLEDMQAVHGQLVTALAVERQLGSMGDVSRGVGDELLGLTEIMADTMTSACNGSPVSEAAIRDLQRGLALAGDETTAQALPDRFTGCDDSTAPPSDDGSFAADGTVTFDFSTSTSSAHGTSTTSAKVTLDLKVREGEYSLIFAKGSKFQARWNYEASVVGEGGELTPVQGCPKSHSWSGSVGTRSPDGGWDPGSNASPEADGFVMQTGDDLAIVLLVSEKDWTADCSAPSIALECPIGDFLHGTLVGDRPREWSFLCSAEKGGEVTSAGGHLVSVASGG